MSRSRLSLCGRLCENKRIRRVPALSSIPGSSRRCRPIRYRMFHRLRPVPGNISSVLRRRSERTRLSPLGGQSAVPAFTSRPTGHGGRKKRLRLTTGTVPCLRNRRIFPTPCFIPEPGKIVPPGRHDRLLKAPATSPSSLPGLLGPGHRLKMRSDTPGRLRNRRTDPAGRFVPENGNTLPPGRHNRLIRTLTAFPDRSQRLLRCGRRLGMSPDTPGRLRNRGAAPAARFIPENGNTLSPGRHNRLVRTLPTYPNRAQRLL
jgi:hypothetical protein